MKELRELGLLDTRPAVSAYSEDGGLAEPPTMGEAAEEEEGPIDEREIERPSAEIVELHGGTDAETVESEAVEGDEIVDEDEALDDDDDESEFEDDDEDDEDFDDEESSGEESSEASDEESVEEDPERKPE